MKRIDGFLSPVLPLPDEWTPLLEDGPTTDDACGFKERAGALATLIREWAIATADARDDDKPADSALVIGLNGPWGSGKSSLAYMVKDRLTGSGEPTGSAGPDDLARQKPKRPVVFEFIQLSAWQFSDRCSFWRAIVSGVLRLLEQRAAEGGLLRKPMAEIVGESHTTHLPAELRQDWRERTLQDVLVKLESSLYRATDLEATTGGQINLGNVLSSLLQTSLSIGSGPLAGATVGAARRALNVKLARSRGRNATKVADWYEECRKKIAFDEVRSIEQFVGMFRFGTGLLTDLREKQEGRGCVCRLWCFLDDLDRCMPEQSVEILETLKAFLDSPYCCYVVAVDPRVVEAGLAARYASGHPGRMRVVDHRDYMEKIFQVRVELGPLSPDGVRGLLDRLWELGSVSDAGPMEAEEPRNEAVFDEAAAALAVVAPFPRKAKRVVCGLGGMRNLASAEPGQVTALICRQAFLAEWGAKYPALIREPAVMRHLYQYFSEGKGLWPALSKGLESAGISRRDLSQMAQDWPFRDLLTRLAASEGFGDLQRAISPEVVAD